MKKAIVTEAQTHTGLTIIKRFLENNYYVYGIHNGEAQQFKKLSHANLKLVDQNQLSIEIFQQVQILIHQAHSIDPCTDFLNSEITQIQETMNKNFYSAVEISKAIIPFMKKQNWGRFIYISEQTSPNLSNFNTVNYRTSVNALEMYSNSIAKEFGQDNILSNMIQVEEMKCAEEIADATLFLTSEDSSFVTGTVLKIS